jgi:hypothetical protein
MSEKIQTGLAYIGLFLLADNLGILEALRRIITGGAS